MDYGHPYLNCFTDFCNNLRSYLLCAVAPGGPLMMTSKWRMVWVVCGLTVWFPHIHAASVSPILLMTTSASSTPASSTEEQSTDPEHQNDVPHNSNNTASVNPILLVTTSASFTEDQSTDHQNDPTGPPNNNTASANPILLVTTSASFTEEQSTDPEHQNDPIDPPSTDTASVSPILLMTTSAPSTNEKPTNPTEHHTDSTQPPISNNTGLKCMSLLPPRRGSYYVEHGTGVSLGSMLVFWCREGYQLVGHEKITCLLQAGVPRWSSYLPVCESIPRPNDQGLRIALLVSVVSGVVILIMTVCFIVCCCQEHMSKKKENYRTGRSRRKEKRSSRFRRSPSWLEREQIDWEAFPPPKLFSLSQRLDRPLPPGSPVYSEVIRSYENRGYERSQESLMRSAHTAQPTHPTNSQIYPALVFQRVQAEPNPTTSSTAPVYIQISTPPKNKTTCSPAVNP
ncbi:uncharacterized protein si:ch211-242e8.1 isoform X1 [Triplophysa rosa]|uniref:Sushi domain-containing protein n=1 Tax=Triplophysa rosa TaxID=992332 RepID=A0A9W7TNG4_TRIRA|nr:uncharacterized protein si:ch211-242e8.1 isoform X1 [Triplophysa rosa]KAI7802228.1 hypothetical protein IRJ41_004324 [Triplophysa rosa]